MILEFYERSVDSVSVGKNTCNNGNFEGKFCFGDLVYYGETLLMISLGHYFVFVQLPKFQFSSS